MNKTKEVIQEYMERDERKIRGRDPKRKVISEEKWSEGNNRNEIVKEGEERENVFLLQRENEEKERDASYHGSGNGSVRTSNTSTAITTWFP